MAHIRRKRFGQHFLADAGVLADIVQCIAPDVADTLVEIGPGTGALTQQLLGRVAHLHAIEIDRDLEAALRARWGGRGDFSLHAADALDFDYGSAVLGRQWRCVGNLPYNISTALLVKLFSRDISPAIADMHFLVQAEVAERLSARAGGGSYGRLSLAAQLYGSAEVLLRVPPEAFDPPPRVQSALVRLRRAEVPGPRSPEAFDRLLRQVFSQRRKMLRRTLGDEALLREAGVEPTARPEQLHLDDFVRLSDLIAACGEKG